MAGPLQHQILPEKIPEAPTFDAVKVPNWGCFLAFGALILGAIISAHINQEPAGSIIIVTLIIVAIVFSSIQHRQAKRTQIEAQASQWMRQQISERESKARELTVRASGLLRNCQDNLRSLPELVRAADRYLDSAEEDFLDRAYAPFWENVEQAAVSLGKFNSRLKQVEVDSRSYSAVLQGRVHNFPAIVVYPDQIPVPSRQAERLRQIVRRGMKDFEFATMWEHRKTQNIMIEGFNSLGDAVNSLGAAVEDSASRVSRAIEESSSQIREEQKQIKLTVEDALAKWEEKKRY